MCIFVKMAVWVNDGVGNEGELYTLLAEILVGLFAEVENTVDPFDAYVPNVGSVGKMCEG